MACSMPRCTGRPAKPWLAPRIEHAAVEIGRRSVRSTTTTRQVIHGVGLAPRRTPHFGRCSGRKFSRLLCGFRTSGTTSSAAPPAGNCSAGTGTSRRLRNGRSDRAAPVALAQMPQSRRRNASSFRQVQAARSRRWRRPLPCNRGRRFSELTRAARLSRTIPAKPSSEKVSPSTDDLLIGRP